jgi:hypothetical protein
MMTLQRRKVLTFALVLMTILALVIAVGTRHISAAKAWGGEAVCVPYPSSIQSNFNGTTIPAGDVIWFTSVMKVKGLPQNSTATVRIENPTIQFAANSQTHNIGTPFGQVTFDPNATSATTTYGGDWETTVPSQSSGNTFLTSSEFVVPAGGLSGGINPVTWSGTFFSTANVPLTVNWQWAAAIYTQFNETDYNALGVKAVDDNHFSPYQNSDHAGTPENFKSYVTGGARGGGGSNYTGSLSGTASVNCPTYADDHETVLASSSTQSLLQFPEGLTSWNGKIYAATLNIVNTSGHDNRIFVFDTMGNLVNTIGDKPGQDLVNTGGINGLTIDRNTGDLYVAANINGQILRIQNPDSQNPTISVYATYPAGGGPEDMAFNQFGTLYASDSNLGVVYAIPPGGGTPQLVIGPAGSGAPVSDNGLLQSPVEGLSPNGVVFSLDYSTLYVANTWADSVVAFDVNSQGQVTGNARIFAQNKNDDLEEYPTGFTGLLQSDTQIGPAASTWLNGPDGLALDSQGDVWVASILGDTITELDSKGHLIATYGTSAVTASGLLNQPASLTFVGSSLYATDLSIFTGLAGQPNLPFRVVSCNVGVAGAGGNGNY